MNVNLSRTSTATAIVAMSERAPLNKSLAKEDLLLPDCGAEVEKIAKAVWEQILRRFRKKGVVVGLSGGIDSSTVAALCVQALGPERVFGLLMPERDSAPDTSELANQVAKHLGIETFYEDISPILDAADCYRRRDDAIRTVIPSYGPGWKAKIVLPSLIDGRQYRLFSVVACSPDGEQVEASLNLKAYLGIVAATNFKQRTRKMLEYYHADRLNFAVAGTANRLEYDQGFFVKLGDGAADIKPIAHLYKTQVYQIAEFLGIPKSIRSRTPTTDTYSLSQSQEEFYFSLPYDKLDLVLFGKNHGYPISVISLATGLSVGQVVRVLRDIEGKRQNAAYLRAAPVLVEPV